MNKAIALTILTVGLLLSAENAQAEEKEKDNDPLAAISLGGTGEWGFPGGKFSRGPSAAVEFPLIKDWVEVGGAKLFRRGLSEWRPKPCSGSRSRSRKRPNL